MQRSLDTAARSSSSEAGGRSLVRPPLTSRWVSSGERSELLRSGRMTMVLENVSVPGAAMGRKMRSADARLVERMRRGDPAAGRHFVGEHYSAVYRFPLCRTGRPEEAAELTQETFVS